MASDAAGDADDAAADADAAIQIWTSGISLPEHPTAALQARLYFCRWALHDVSSHRQE